MSEKIVFHDSPEAAIPVTVQAWKSTDGRVYLDEYSARLFSATHSKCTKCEDVIPRGTSLCEACRNKIDQARWDQLAADDHTAREWDEGGMVYSAARDKFYAHWESIAADCDGTGEQLIKQIRALRLHHTTPTYAVSKAESCLDGIDEDMPPDTSIFDVEPDLETLIDEFLQKIRETMTQPIYYEPEDVAVLMPRGIRDWLVSWSLESTP